MSKVIRLSQSLVVQAREQAKVSRRSPAQQIEYWARLGKAAEDNPELTVAMLHDVLSAQSLKPISHQIDINPR
jgi:hypothetical protein